MHLKPLSPLFLFGGLAAAIGAPGIASAAFIEDGTASLELRNFYMNRDYRDDDKADTPQHKGQAKAKADEWGQGFILNLQSGFTEGPVGFGVDALGLLGVKLDSGAGTSGTGTLPRSPATAEPVDDYSFLGLTAKARLSNTVLTLGTHTPTLPVLFRNDTRMLPQTFEGAQILSKEFEGLTLLGGQFRSTRLRDSSNYDDMTMFADGSSGGVASDRFNYAGGSYAFTPKLTATYYYAELEDNYSQHHVNLLHVLPLSERLGLKSDIRYFKSDGEGNARVDNRNLGAMFSLLYAGHSLGLGYQDQSGDTGMPFVGGGTDPWTLNTLTYHHFLRAGEDGWQVRYDYDFAAAGLPGLSLMARYVHGDNFEIGGVDAKEWERDVDLAYTVQSGPLKNFNVRWRNVMYRGSHTTDLDENRLIVSYTLKF
ncbi:MAG: outer membrane porin, OprD family [Stutzerimonas stutzeri]|nr:MAG: outer membrane porin, OprD family [Stutzerimonas stutzeri]